MAVYTVTFKQLTDNYAVLQTLTGNDLEVGRSFTVAGVGAPFNGTFRGAASHTVSACD